jgi:hypothetical protein
VINADWGIGVRNVLDREIEHPAGDDLRMTTVPQPGRTLFATLGASL